MQKEQLTVASITEKAAQTTVASITEKAAQTTVASITEKAAEKVKEFIIRENKVDAGLRIYVAGGGCSGLTYGMALEATASDDDTIVEDHGVKVYIDPFSLKYLQGSVVDYAESLMGSGFKIENPNVVSSCACGQSFHTG